MKRFPRFALAFALLASRALAAQNDQRLANLSTRAQVGTGGNIAVVGFVIAPGSSKSVLIRAVGPGLGGFGVAGTLSDPLINLYDSATPPKLVASNDNWSTTSVGGATTFSSVGAFGLTTNSRDAALLATLTPGSYTAQVSGVNNASGIALVEVYDVTGVARLMNLSTRAMVGTDAGVLISGLSIAAGGGARKILVRAAGPTLGTFGVTGTLVDPAIAVMDANNTQVASNDNWDSTNGPALKAAFTQVGAFPFPAGSKDAALLADLLPGSNYTIQVSGVGRTTGVALVEIYDLTPDNATTVSVAASVGTTDAKGAAPGVFTFARTGSTASALTVYYELAGSAVNGVDYTQLPGSVTIPAGAASATINVTALAGSGANAINKDVTVNVAAGPGYTVGTNSAPAAVTIFYNPGTLYIAPLRALATAPTSTAYGTATVQLSSDNSFAAVNLTFSNLTSPETAVYLRLGNPGEVGADLVALPTGQVNGQTWFIQSTSAYSAADIVAALKAGRVFLDIQTASYPGGELRGTFIQSSGSLAFTPPAAAPALADTPLTASDAARFLTQATFGPMKSEIDALTGKRQADLRAWIDAQMALPASLHLDATRADFNTFTALGENPQFSQQNRQAAWWKLAVTAPDQLRQRVAFALSELFVVSDVNSTLFNNSVGMANYYDLMVNGAFGNFRTLLENVTLSPIMGVYLSALRSGKATYDSKGNLLTSADENYAREVMQLFTIGLNQLQPDGTLKLDPSGLPIPTYNQTTITETAKVFTGWAFYSTNPTPSFRGEATNYLQPMMLYPAFHDDTTKTLVGGVQVPANQGGAADLRLTLDTLFNHPNTGPFIARQLIQRLVTSNPSPGYVYRVAQVFANDGSGTRGNLGAVVRAILTDYEARSAAVAATASFGKLKEPLLRATAVLRAFNGGTNGGRFPIFNPEGNLAEAALRAPTVFNFFQPDYISPGLLAGAGLFAPEYQILTDTTAISAPNQLWNYIYANRPMNDAANVTTVGIKLDDLLPLARTPQALVDQANLILAGGSAPKSVTDRIVTAVSAMPAGTTATPNSAADIERVRSALYLTVSLPQGAVQK